MGSAVHAVHAGQNNSQVLAANQQPQTSGSKWATPPCSQAERAFCAGYAKYLAAAQGDLRGWTWYRVPGLEGEKAEHKVVTPIIAELVAAAGVHRGHEPAEQWVQVGPGGFLQKNGHCARWAPEQILLLLHELRAAMSAEHTLHEPLLFGREVH